VRRGCGALLWGALFASFLCVGVPARAADDAEPADARAIVARAWANLFGRNSIERVEIRASRPDSKEFLRTAQVIRRGTRDGELNRMLVRFVGSGELRGVSLLLLEGPNFEYDAFLFQPALHRTRRISVAQRRDAFFGTDVFFEDLEAKRAAQWNERLLRTESVLGRPAWVIEIEPAGLPSGYERVVIWFDQALPVMLRAEFHRGGRQIKSFEVDPARIESRDGFQVPLATTFRGENGSVTEVVITEIEFRDALPDRLFSPESLEFSDERQDLKIK
jgi:hypothetical protein